MRLTSLTVHNIGVFRERCEFKFEPDGSSDGAKRHLTIINGHNGAGKTTLFEAIALALFGSSILGPRVSQQAYGDYLLSRLHRRTNDGSSSISDEGGITLFFNYVQSGRLLRIMVDRKWRYTSSRVSEILEILKDGVPPDVPHSDYQAWLNEFIPPGLFPLCFFDAEGLDGLANPERHDRILKGMLGRLLGLDLIERLRDDLDYYLLNEGDGHRIVHLQDAVLKEQATYDELKARVSELEIVVETLITEERELETRLAEYEERLASEGGTYLARRPELRERLGETKQEIDKASTLLREAVSGLLPFGLVPELCSELAHRLDREAEIQRDHIVHDLFQKRVEDIEGFLQSNNIWDGLDLSPETRQTLLTRLVRTLHGTDISKASSEEPLIHHLAGPEHRKLIDWIQEAESSVPQQVKALGEELRNLRVEQRKIESELQRIPDEESIAPLRKMLKSAQEQLIELQRRQNSAEEQLRGLRLRCEEQLRKQQQAVEQLTVAQSSERRFALAERAKLILRTYQDAATRQRLANLEEKLVTAFNVICRKDYMLAKVSIDPDDFQIRLHGGSGETLSLNDFSAGERQLYAMALLWALRQVSGRELPLVIDMPLARLDEIHRWRLMRHYLPNVSSQIILFTTDAEFGTGQLSQLGPYVAHVYHLNYDPLQEHTICKYEDGLSDQRIMLFKKETPGRVSVNTHNGHGETWSTDPDCYGEEGELRRAMLTGQAKRLTLVHPLTHEYNWSQIGQLELLAKDPSIIKKLRNGARLHEIWNDKWIRFLKKAGYDSISTMGMNGPEEYVLNPSKLVPIGASQRNGEELVYGS